MYRDLIVQLAEVCFWLTGGIPIMMSPWLILYVAVFVAVTASTLWAILNDDRWVRPTLYAILFFVQMAVLLAIPVAQIQMIRQCEAIEATVTADHIAPVDVQLVQCRKKLNYYEEFGVWQLTNTIKLML